MRLPLYRITNYCGSALRFLHYKCKSPLLSSNKKDMQKKFPYFPQRKNGVLQRRLCFYPSFFAICFSMYRGRIKYTAVSTLMMIKGMYAFVDTSIVTDSPAQYNHAL